MSTWDGVERRRSPAWAEVAALRAELAEARDLLRWRRTTAEKPAEFTPVLAWSVGSAHWLMWRERYGGEDVWLSDEVYSTWWRPPEWWRPLGPLPDQKGE